MDNKMVFPASLFFTLNTEKPSQV